MVCPSSSWHLMFSFNVLPNTVFTVAEADFFSQIHCLFINHEDLSLSIQTTRESVLEAFVAAAVAVQPKVKMFPFSAVSVTRVLQ